MKKSPTIVFFGTEDFSLVSLDALIKAGFNVAAVVTKPDSKRGRGHTIQEPPVKTFAKKAGVTVLQPESVNEITDFVSRLGNPAGVLVSYGKIIPSRIICLFSPGIINLHPSLLPKYRGPSPIESVILRGESSTGVSIMKIEEKMDAGPVYKQHKITLNGTEAKPELYEKLARIGAQILVEALPLIVDGTLPAHPQNDDAASYSQLLSKDISLITPSQLSAQQAERHIRAYLGFPRSRIQLGGSTCIVLKAHVATSKQAGSLVVTCKDNTFLAIDQLIAPSGKTMSGEDFVRGYGAVG